jgi:hypothetical protein
LKELIASEDPKIALRAIELAMRPMVTQMDGSARVAAAEIVYRSKFGPSGELIQEKMTLDKAESRKKAKVKDAEIVPTDTNELLGGYEPKTAAEKIQENGE